MKKAKKIVAFFTSCALVFSACVVSSNSAEARTNTKPTDSSKKEAAKTPSQQYADSMQPGWNLGNSFDSVGNTGETSWGNPPVTEALLEKVKGEGFKSIRIPLTVYGRVGTAPNYTIDSTYLNRYAQVVKMALALKLKVMINIHHDSWEWAEYINADDDNGAAMAEYKAIWTQLSSYFKDYSSDLCFESLNEPTFKNHSGDVATDVQLKRLDAVNTEFHSIVRSSGGNNAARMLVMPTLNTNNSDDRCASLYNTIAGLKDPNIVATLHYYGYWPFSVNIAGSTTMDSNTVSDINASFDRMYNNFTAKGVGVVVGEYGLLSFDGSAKSDVVEHGELLKYIEYLTYYAKSKGIAMMLWDNGGMINRQTYKWNDAEFSNVVKASFKTRSSYVASDELFVKKEASNKDIPVSLTLNGNTLASIYNGNTKLKLGTDYTYSNGVVTLKGAYISRLINGNYGTKATLTFKFSAGADFNVDINYENTPLLGKGKGTTAGFNIPIQFNGSKLLTLEALNADGTATGPANWTTYKQFGDSFTVDYTTNTLTMTNTFFNACNDGTITLKLHFESGEVLQCNITKSGTTVTAN